MKTANSKRVKEAIKKYRTETGKDPYTGEDNDWQRNMENRVNLRRYRDRRNNRE
tara:strand:+ start:1018 stop:1179 length:162 start_codon:yes stop_codon:yes gene_type:complete